MLYEYMCYFFTYKHYRFDKTFVVRCESDHELPHSHFQIFDARSCTKEFNNVDYPTLAFIDNSQHCPLYEQLALADAFNINTFISQNVVNDTMIRLNTNEHISRFTEDDAYTLLEISGITHIDYLSTLTRALSIFIIIIIVFQSLKRIRERQISRSTRNAGNSLTVPILDSYIMDDVPEDNCTICIQEFVKGEECIMLPCEHTFHKQCINEWIQVKRRSALCPNCNENVFNV